MKTSFQSKILIGLLIAYSIEVVIYAFQNRWDLRYHLIFPIIFSTDIAVSITLTFTYHKNNLQHIMIVTVLAMFYQSLFIMNSFMIVKGIGYKYSIAPKNVMLGCSELLFSGAFASYCKFICRQKKVTIKV